jgi:hypothetical protein
MRASCNLTSLLSLPSRLFFKIQVMASRRSPALSLAVVWASCRRRLHRVLLPPRRPLTPLGRHSCGKWRRSTYSSNTARCRPLPYYTTDFSTCFTAALSRMSCRCSTAFVTGAVALQCCPLGVNCDAYYRVRFGNGRVYVCVRGGGLCVWPVKVSATVAFLIGALSSLTRVPICRPVSPTPPCRGALFCSGPRWMRSYGSVWTRTPVEIPTPPSPPSRLRSACMLCCVHEVACFICPDAKTWPRFVLSYLATLI